MELFGCAVSPAWAMQPGSDLIYYSNMEEIMRRKYSLSSCWVLKWWSVCLNELLTLHIKLHKPFYFERILLRPNTFSLWVLSCVFFSVLGHFPANGLSAAQLTCAFCSLPWAVCPWCNGITVSDYIIINVMFSVKMYCCWCCTRCSWCVWGWRIFFF